MCHFQDVRFIPGDETKTSLKSRGLSFEMIISAPVLGFVPHPSRPSQMILLVEIAGYVHAAPCEWRGEAWRIITAFPSRKYHKYFHP